MAHIELERTTPDSAQSFKTEIISSIEISHDPQRTYENVRHNPNVIIPADRYNLKVGTLFSTKFDTGKREIILTDGTSPFVLHITIDSYCHNYNLLGQYISWIISNDKMLTPSDIFAERSRSLSAIIVDDSQNDNYADKDLTDDLKKQGIKSVETIHVKSPSPDLNIPWNIDFDAATGQLNVYFWREQDSVSIKTYKQKPELPINSLYYQYLQYLDLGGEFPWELYKQAMTNTAREIYEKHPFDHTLILRTEEEKAEEKRIHALSISSTGRTFDPDLLKAKKLAMDEFILTLSLRRAKELAENASGSTGIIMTPRQLELFRNFRLMNEGAIYTYNYGWHAPNDKGERSIATFRTPAQFEPGHELLDQVLKMTGDLENLRLLSAWKEKNISQTDEHIKMVTEKECIEQTMEVLEKPFTSDYETPEFFSAPIMIYPKQ